MLTNAEALARATAASPPETCALVHGLYLRNGACMACDRCTSRDTCPAFVKGGRCQVEADYMQERRQQLALALVDVRGDPALAAPLIDMVVIAEVRLARAVRFTAEVGEWLPETEYDGAVYTNAAKEIPKLMKAVASALAVCGLTPSALRKQRAEKRSGPDLLAALYQAKQLEAGNDAGETVDAEFSEEIGDGEKAPEK